MRRDDVLLVDMQRAAQRIAEHIAGYTREQFVTEGKTRDAVERQILNLGEAANRISASFKDAHPEIPWRRLVELRNFYIHAYERVDPDGVWNTAQGLVRRVEQAIAPLVPPSEE